MGVKKSTSDLFINNCDEFLYYDDLVRPEPVKRRQGSSTKATNPGHGWFAFKRKRNAAVLIVREARFAVRFWSNGLRRYRKSESSFAEIVHDGSDFVASAPV